MAQEAIFLPVLALVALTFTVLLFIPLRRFGAVFAGQATADDFKLGESANVPGHVSLPNRNYMNLLELPILFYAVSIAFYVTGKVDGLVLELAWAYFAFRLLHSLLHMTFNHVLTRVLFFTLSNFALMALWIVFGLRIWGTVA